VVRLLRGALTVVVTAAAGGAAAVTTAAASAGGSCRLAWMSSSVQMPNSKQRRNLSETARKKIVYFNFKQCSVPTFFHYETFDCTVPFTSYKFFFGYLLTINVPLFKKLRDIIFFLRDNNF
jgi:hypothetical protein